MSNEVTGPKNKEEEYYKSYAEFSKTLRTWFVAYGIGGPVVLISNDAAWAAMRKSTDLTFIGLLFLVGGALQILSALLNRHAMWFLYFGEFKPPAKEWISYKIANWYSDQGWIDVAIDVLTVVLFGWATLLAFSAITSIPPDTLIPALKGP